MTDAAGPRHDDRFAAAAGYNASSTPFFIGVTDYDRFRRHASKPAVEEINFRTRSAAEQVFVVDTIDGTHRSH